MHISDIVATMIGNSGMLFVRQLAIRNKSVRLLFLKVGITFYNDNGLELRE